MLLFEVTGQSLKRTDHFNPATDSVEYLKAKFTFNDSAWSGKTKTALFRIGTVVYKSVLGSDGACKVPSEVLVGGGSRVSRIHGDTILVSLIGEYSTTRITTNEISIKLNRSGYADAETPANPTETEYTQLTAVVADAMAECESAREECETARDDLVGVKNIFANAIKGNLSGAVVRADDVTPVEHNPIIWVHGANLFDKNAATSGYGLVTATGGLYEASGYATTDYIRVKPGVVYSCDWLVKKWLCFYDENKKYIYQYENNSPVTIPDGAKYVRITFMNTEMESFQFVEGETADSYSAYISPDTVTVKRCGKNLLGYTGNFEYTINGITVKYDAETQIFTLDGTKTTDSGFEISLNGNMFPDVALKAGEKYALSVYHINGTLTAENSVNVFYIGNADTSGSTSNNWGSVPFPENKRKSAILTASRKYFVRSWLYFGVTDAVTFTNYKFRVQLEKSESPSDNWEPYNGEIKTAAADGIVDGITSFSSCMTLLANKDGVTIECEYIRDTNKVIKNIVNAITALGGTV